MKHFRSLVLNAGSLGLFLGSTTARADSIPTLTATSVSYCSDCPNTNNWTISGNAFSLSGSNETFADPGQATPGQSLATNYSLVTFFATVGLTTEGILTLDGATHHVKLAEDPSFVFAPYATYEPAVTGTTLDGSFYVINKTATAPASIVGDTNGNRPFALQDYSCSATNQSPCVIANLYIDVPGTATFTEFGFRAKTSTSSREFISRPPRSRSVVVSPPSACL